jgi:hypothetical protein
LWIANINIYIVSPEALLFFSFGYYIVKYSLNEDKIDRIGLMDISIAYIITIILELFFDVYIPIIHKLNIIIGSIFFIKLTFYFIKKDTLYIQLAWLEKYAFIVYALHGVVLPQLQKLMVRIIPMYGGFLFIEYFCVTILGIMVCLVFGIIFRKMFPKIYAILTGGRI